MAIYHLSAKTASRGKGQSARAAAGYLVRDGKYARQPDPVLFVASGHMPAWAGPEHAAGKSGERADGALGYWDAADLYERANARLFKTIEVALPVELSPSEQRSLVVGFAQSVTAAEGLPWTLAIHAGGGENPHAHLMISERVNDGEARSASTWFRRHDAAKEAAETGARKSRALMPRAWLESTRATWAEQANVALERAGREERIDHRSLEAQGLERLPTFHLGTAVVEMEGRGVRTERGARALAVEAANDQIQELQQQREAVGHERDGQDQGLAESRDARRAAARESARAGRRDGAAERAAIADAGRGVGAERGSPELGGGARGEPRAAVAGLDRVAGGGGRDVGDGGGGADRAAGAGDGGARRRGTPERDERGAQQPPAGRGVAGLAGEGGRAAGERGAAVGGRDGAAAPGGRAGVARGVELAVAAVDRGGDRGDGAVGSAADRIVGLAAPGLDAAGGAGRVAVAADPARAGVLLDRTAEAVARQLRGMGAGRYEVAVREPGSETGEVRRWTVEEVGAALPWLKRANAQGREVLVRPAAGEDAELVLVAGLNPERVAAMTAAGRELAVVVEASPGRLEGWVRVPGCDEARRQEILRQLATERGADPERMKAGRYGRLAGFTNPRAGDERGRPWVLCRSSSGRVASAGAELVAAAGQRLEARARAVIEARWHERERERERSRGRGGMEL